MQKDLSWLKESFKAIDRVYFSDSCSVEGFTVKWMPWRPTKHTFTFGLCDKDNKVILIHRALAHDWVPDHVVLGVLYHEMLHIIISDDHDAEFNIAEQKFVHFALNLKWEDENLRKLIDAPKP